MCPVHSLDNMVKKIFYQNPEVPALLMMHMTQFDQYKGQSPLQELEVGPYLLVLPILRFISPVNFHRIRPLGRFGLVVAMSTFQHNQAIFTSLSTSYQPT